MSTNSLRYVNKIIDVLNENGYEAFIVGGAVRDTLLQRKIHDYDIATNAPIDKVIEIFPKTIPVAIKHGTVIVRENNVSFEVSTYKGDDLLEDLQRRDFTINAMAMTKEGTIIDPYFGKDDLAKNRVKGVANPSSRFKEDPLRILRAIRFACELHYTIDASTYEAIIALKERLSTVAIERIIVEFEKICFANPVVGFNYINNTSIFLEIPKLKEIHKVIHNETAEVVKELYSSSQIWGYLIYKGKLREPRSFLRSLKLSNKVTKEAMLIVELLQTIIVDGWNQNTIYRIGLHHALLIEEVRAAMLNELPNVEAIKHLYDELPIKNKQELALKGEEIVKLLHQDDSKSKIGELLAICEKAVLNGIVHNNRHELLLWLVKEGYIRAQ